MTKRTTMLLATMVVALLAILALPHGMQAEVGETFTDSSLNITFQVLAEGENGQPGTVTLTNAHPSISEVTIPEIVPHEGKTYKVTSIGESAFEGCWGLTDITLPNSVTSIGYYAFAGCSGLTDITLPNGVTSIGQEAFVNCSSLTSIKLPASVTSIGDGAFANCSSLTSIKLPASVTSIGDRAFAGCLSLPSITLPARVTSIGDGTFANCRSLAGIELPNSVTSIGDYAFVNCSSLAGIELPNSVTSIGDNAFAGCSALELLIFKNADESQASTLKATITSQNNVTYHKLTLVDGKLASDTVEGESIYYIKGGASLGNALEKEGYTFQGWFDQSSDGQQMTAMPESDTILYAKWTIDDYKLSLVLNDGEWAKDYQVPTSYTYGSALALPTTEQITRSGYTFAGWYEDEKFTGSPVTVIPADATGDKTYYAKWTKKPSSSSSGGTLPPQPSTTPTVKPSEGGTVETSPKNPSFGEEVIITPKPETGKEVKEVIVTDKDGTKRIVTQRDDGTYSFRQPTGAVTIEVIFAPVGEVPAPHDFVKPFTDVPIDAWFADDVRYVYDKGLMLGTSDTSFSPQMTTTRGMIVTTLWRMSGSPEPAKADSFADVGADTYYAKAIAWASEEGIASGYDAQTFAPDKNVSREELVAFLYRYAKHEGKDMSVSTDLTNYADYAQVGDWARDNMAWAVATKLVAGNTDNTLTPQAQATRAQLAALLHRYSK